SVVDRRGGWLSGLSEAALVPGPGGSGDGAGRGHLGGYRAPPCDAATGCGRLFSGSGPQNGAQWTTGGQGVFALGRSADLGKCLPTVVHAVGADQRQCPPRP